MAQAFWIPPLIFIVSVIVTRGLCGERAWLRIEDHPNERSLHTQPTPRTGGVAIATGLIAGLLYAWGASGVPGTLAAVALGCGLVGGVSLLDDFRHVAARWRFLVHTIAAVILVSLADLGLRKLGLPPFSWSLPVWPGAVLTVVAVIWMINLYNFMDGMDGFAAGMAAIGFSAMAGLAWLGGNGELGLASLSVAAAAAGFLIFNFPKARIFMGDLGSSSLGFLAIAFALWGDRSDAFPLWAALLVFSPFIVDATVTLMIRLARGERVWEAHRSHAYQRLVQHGWGHKKTVLRAYLLMAACALSAVAAVKLGTPYQSAVLIAWGLAYIVLWRGIGQLCAHRNTA
ncbi:MAG: hypothetical protein GC138_07585 [Gammaproteobacteria bacterium]|nr:hypothetical protein [Gammaproteobacteria bacterium]